MFFRNKKRMSEVEGYDRISRMIEDRQGEAGDGDEDLFEEDTVLLTREPRGTVLPPGREIGAAGDALAPDDQGVEESVTVVRAPERPERPAMREPAPTVTPAVAPVAQPAPPPVAPPATPAPTPYTPPPLESPRMPLPDISAGAAQAGSASLVAKDAMWEGKLVCSGNVRIEGALRGEIETTGTLVVAAEARVDGTVRARNVTLADEIKGDLQCEERLEVLPGGAARGEVNTGALVVHEGAFIDSRFQMRREAATG